MEVILGEWDDPASPEDRQDPAADTLRSYGIEETDPRWAVLICDLLEHFLDDEKDTCIKWFKLINEPHGGWSACGWPTTTPGWPGPAWTAPAPGR